MINPLCILTDLKDLVYIIFLIGTAVLALLTYRNAKKTLFNPIRSEMVKYQMKVITEFIDHHTSNGVDLEAAINYKMLLKLNYDLDYLLQIYSDEHTFENHDFTDNDLILLQFCKESLGGLFEVRIDNGKIYMDETFAGDFDSMKQYLHTPFVKSKEVSNSELKRQRIFFTSQFLHFYTDLRSLESNPFVPQQIKKKLQDIIQNITLNFRMLYELLTEHSSDGKSVKYQQLLDKLYSVKIHHFKDLQELREQIAQYFKVNSI